MKNCIIYNSYSGNTRSVAESIHAALGGRLIEVTSREYSFRLTAYIIGCYRARKGLSDRIEPHIIDVSSDDLIIIGTPVWGGRATPAINAAVGALKGCEGRSAVIFATCGGKEGETLSLLKKALEDRGVMVTGQFVFDKTGIRDPEKIHAMIAAIQKAAGP